MIENILEKILSESSQKYKDSYLRFFKKDANLNKDEFLGVKVPYLRSLARKNYKNLNLNELTLLIQNYFHEIRYFALCVLILKFKKNKNQQKEIYDFYINNLKCINNWDLVDISAPYIIGEYLKGNISELYNFINSKSLWEKRILIVSQLSQIKKGKYAQFMSFVKYFLSDKEDLVQKPIGWMLREVGKINEKELDKFLNNNIHKISRVALRYAIEKYPEDKRKIYLNLTKIKKA